MSTQRRKGKRFLVMDQTSQTDQERRELRAKLHKLNSTIAEKADQIADVQLGAFADVRQESTNLWRDVKYTREAVLDADNIKDIAMHASRQVFSLIHVPRYESIRFAAKLKDKLSSANDVFDWKRLGSEVGVCFNAIPAYVRFLSGPLDDDFTQYKELKRTTRRVSGRDSDVDSVTLIATVNNQQQGSAVLSTIEQNIGKMERVLKRRYRIAAAKEVNDDSEESDSKRRRTGEISAIHMLFNPKSFTQTVENLFHFSFMLKNGSVQIYATDDKGPMIKPAPASENQPTPRQSILSFNMQDWRRLTQTYGVEKSLMPHRTVAKGKRP